MTTTSVVASKATVPATSVSHVAAAIFLCAVIGLWRFQIPIAGVGIPLFVPLIGLLVFMQLPLRAITRIGVATFVLLVFFGVNYAGGVAFARPEVSLLSMLMLAACWLVTASALRDAVDDRWRALSLGLKILLRVQLALQLLEIAGAPVVENRLQPHYFLPIDRVSGLFVEPSHVGITFSFLVFASLWRQDRVLGGNMSRADYLVLGLILLICPSATAISVILLALAVRVVQIHTITGIVIFGLLCLLPLGLLGASSFLPVGVSERLYSVVDIFSTGHFDRGSNLSALVFYGGYLAALNALEISPLLGVGFNNMVSSYFGDRLYLYMMASDGLNIHDGSSFLFKVVAEFGFFGLLFLAYSGVVFVFRVVKGGGDLTLVIFLFPLFAYFFRGAGYFDGPILIATCVAICGFSVFSKGPASARTNARSESARRSDRVRLAASSFRRFPERRSRSDL